MNTSRTCPNSSKIKLMRFNISTDNEQYNKNSCLRGVDGQAKATILPLIPHNIAYFTFEKKENNRKR